MRKIRVELTKGEEIRYISHLDYASSLERAVRRTGVSAAYSEGFNPHMKISFASALAVGVTSAAEYMDIELKDDIAAATFADKLAMQLPPGIRVLAARLVEGKQPSLMAMVDCADYVVDVPFAGELAEVLRAVKCFNDAPEVFYTRKTPKATKEIEIKQYVKKAVEARQEGAALRFWLAIEIMPSGSVKPSEVIKAMIAHFQLPVEEEKILIHRLGLYVQGVKPIDKAVWRG